MNNRQIFLFDLGDTKYNWHMPRSWNWPPLLNNVMLSHPATYFFLPTLKLSFLLGSFRLSKRKQASPTPTMKAFTFANHWNVECTWWRLSRLIDLLCDQDAFSKLDSILLCQRQSRIEYFCFFIPMTHEVMWRYQILIAIMEYMYIISLKSQKVVS